MELMENRDNEKNKGDDEMIIPHIMQAVKSIRYGYVQIVIQNSKIVQIEKTEKFRFDKENK